MKGQTPALLPAFAAVVIFLASPAPARNRLDEVIVRFSEKTTGPELQRVLDENGAHVDGEITALRLMKLKLPPGHSLDTVLARLGKFPGMELAEPNAIIHQAGIPNDYGLTGSQWGLEKIGAVKAWGMTVTGAMGDASVIIAVLDTGIMSTHEEMQGKLVEGVNIVTPGTKPEDDEFHGTYVAGIAAAATDNSAGIAGVAWKARLMPIKILKSDGTGDEFGMISGMNWALDHGARVINMSVGSCNTDGTCSPGSHFGAEAMEKAWRRGAILVAATGNEGIKGASYPASYPYVLGVGSTDNADRRSRFSNFGGMVDLMAPGGDCSLTASTDILGPGITTNASYIVACGTSASAPFVSGLAAVLLAQDPTRTNAEVVRIMESTADPIDGAGWNEMTGYGRINMYKALVGQENAPPSSSLSTYNYPNPFSPRLDRGTSFVVHNLDGRELSIEIRDMHGNILWTKQYTAAEAAGMDLYYNSQLRWDGRDSKGKMVPNGVYFATVKAGSAHNLVKVAVVH